MIFCKPSLDILLLKYSSLLPSVQTLNEYKLETGGTKKPLSRWEKFPVSSFSQSLSTVKVALDCFRSLISLNSTFSNFSLNQPLPPEEKKKLKLES